MWKDGNNDIFEVYKHLETKTKFPTKCPICKKNGAHVFMHIENVNSKRGALWIWCSECFVFAHATIYVPNYWENMLGVEEIKLAATPDYLEHIKLQIDEHVNHIMCRSDL